MKMLETFYNERISQAEAPAFRELSEKQLKVLRRSFLYKRWRLTNLQIEVMSIVQSIANMKPAE